MPKEGILESVPWYFDDWWNDDAAMALTPAERLLYFETILCASKFGLVPLSFKASSQKVKLPERFVRQHWPKVEPFFYKTEGGWAHRKVDEVRSKKFKIKVVKSAAGVAGNDSRWSHMRLKEDRKEIADGFPEASQNDRSRARSPSPSLTPITYNEQTEPKKRIFVDEETPTVLAARRFEAEYPQVVTDIDVRNFVSQVQTDQDRELFFKVLAANNASDKWKNGYHVNAEKYLTTGMWRKMPKGPREVTVAEIYGNPDPEGYL